MTITKVPTKVTGKPKKKRPWHLFFLALPLMIFVFFFSYVPLFGWYLAFIEYRPGIPILDSPWVGFQFFEIFFTSRDFPRVMGNTLIFAFLQFLSLPLPMLFAILLNEITSTKFRRISQTVTTLPHFISWVTVFSLSFALFSSGGMLNDVLTMFGLPTQNVLANADAVYWFQHSMWLWKGLGWSAIIYIAAIAGLDQELYEAAVVDGAGRFRCAVHITVPGLMPTFIVLMILNISHFVNSGLEQYLIFRNPVVAANIEVIELFVFRTGLQLFDFSYAIAVGIFRSVVSIMLLIAANLVAKKIRGSTIL